MAYRADIEIAVRGAQDLKRLQNEISATSKLIDNLNNYIENIGSGGVVRNINNLQDVVHKAANAFNAAALNTQEATIAAKKYISATEDLNAGLRERQALLKSINEEERKTRLNIIGREVGGRPSSGYSGPIGPGQASPVGSLVGQKSPVAERVQRTIQARQDELQLQQALLRLEEKSAAELNKKVQSQEALVQGTREVLALIDQQNRRQQFLAGKSGALQQGPLAPAGAMGFPVALPLTQVEQKALEITGKKQEILQRTATTRQQLVGLAANLQRLELNSAVAIADANKEQQQLNAAKEEAVKLSERELLISKQGALTAGRFSPIGGAENIPGSPAARAAAAGRRREALSNAVIGGAFPLLFGQGPGAAIGGGLGGAAGGLAGGQFGFGLSLVGTAVGQAVDTLITKTVELGGALLSVASTFDTLKERALISNREREKELQLLQDAGFAATANAAAQQELYKTIGVSGVENLRQLGSETDRLNRTWAELSAQLQGVVAGPLADLAAKLNEFFKPIAQAGRAEALREDLNPADKARFDQELNRLAAKGTYRPTGQMNRSQLEALATFKPEQLQATLDKFGKLRVNAEVKLDPAQVREQTVNILQKQLEVLDITKKFTEAGEKQREIDRQRYEIIENYEDSIAAIRRRIEDEISNKRLSVIQKENELLDVQARIRQESLSLANMQAQATAGQGLPTGASFTTGNDPFRSRAYRDVAQQAAEAAGSFLEQELALAEQAAKLKRDAAFDALRTDLEAAKFQADTAREVNKLNIDTAKKVAALNDNIRKQNAQQDGRRFEIERQLALLRLDTIRAEYELLKKYSVQVRDLGMLGIVGEALLDLKEARETISRAQPPAAVRQAAGPAMQGVSFAGLDAINEQLRVTQERINAAQLALNDLLVLKNQQEFINKMQRIAGSIDAPIETLNEELATNEKTRTRYAELIRQGVRGAVAERLIEVEQLKEAAVLQYEAVIAELEKKLAVEGTNKALEDQIKKFKQRRDAVEGRASAAAAGIQKEESPAERLQGAITKAREELNDLTDPINQVIAGAAAIGDAFQEAFKGLVSGAMTGQEALAAFFKGVGDHFLDMASKMLAKLIEIYILETVLGFIAGSAGSGGASSPVQGTTVPVSQMPAGMAFAEGGFVTGPTRALIGEGGESEYVIPASKMGAAMSRYSAGARGAAVIPGNGASGGGGTVGGGSGSIDVRYTVERINSVDYVTADQFQRGMAQAAKQGAEQGERRALSRLQNSPSVRRRVGV